MKKLQNTILFSSAFILPLLLFEFFFRQLEANQYARYYAEIRIIYIPLALIFAVFLVFYKNSKKYNKTISLVVYVLFYCLMCYQIADEYKHNFGTTWQKVEVFLSLVLSQWYFYIFGGLGLVSFTFLLFSKLKDAKNND